MALFGKKKKMDKPVLKVYIERPQVYASCFDIDYGETDDFLTFHLKDEIEEAKDLLRRIRREFPPDVLEIQSLDPRNILFIGDVFKYKLKGKEPTWIIEWTGEPIVFRGVPRFEELAGAISAVIEEMKRSKDQQ